MPSIWDAPWVRARTCRRCAGPDPARFASTTPIHWPNLAEAPLIGLSQALGHLPSLRADGAATRHLEQGKRVARAALEPADVSAREGVQGERFQVLRPDGTLLAVAEVRDDDTMRTLRVFH